MDFRLKTFLLAGETENITKTGEILGLTQPAVSQQIKALEREYGVPLFSKKGKYLRLTEAGRFLLQEVQKQENRMSRIRRELASFRGGRRSYTIGATLTVGEYILPSYLQSLQNRDPLRKLTVQIGNTERILEELKKENLDLAVIEGFFRKGEFSHRILCRDEMIFVTAPATPWGKYKNIGAMEIRECPFIIRESGSGTREYFETYLEQHGERLSPDAVSLEIGSLNAIRTLCVRGAGVTVISRKAVERELAEKTLTEIPFEWGPLIREIAIVYLEENPGNLVEDLLALAES